MRRHGQYADSGVNTHVPAKMQHMPVQQMELNSTYFQEQLEAFTPEREPHGSSETDRQWRWEQDGQKVSNPMAAQMYNEGQGVDGSRNYFQGQRLDQKLSSDKQNSDSRARPHEEDMEVGYEDTRLTQTFEGLEKQFLDDIMKLAKEQNDTEDAENARHREKINAINTQYQEQLAALRLQHASLRDEFLRKEFHARKQQYQQSIMDHYPSSSAMGPSDIIPRENSHGYSSIAGSAAVGGTARAYNSGRFDSYRERSRYQGSNRDHGFEPRGGYPGGRVYDTGSRYY